MTQPISSMTSQSGRHPVPPESAVLSPAAASLPDPPTPAVDPPPVVDPTPGVDLRAQVVERLRQMSANFIINAWELRFSDPLSPHALAYLYLRHDPRRAGFWQLGTAWQMWIADPAVRVLPQLLYDLHHTFAPRATGAGFDIRQELSAAADNHMRPGTDEWAYTGLAVISLDTAKTTWEQQQATARLSLDIAAIIRIVLNDGTVMVCRQAGRTGYGTFTIESSQPLAYGTVATRAPWKRVDPATILAHDHDPDALRWTGELSDTLSQADNGRIVALRHAAGQKRGHRL